MRSVATWCVRHRRLVLAGWLVALVGLTFISSSVGTAYKDSFSLNGTQSFEAQNLLTRVAPKASGDREQIVVAVSSGKVTDAGGARARPRRCSLASPRFPTSPRWPRRSGRTARAQISRSGQDRLRERDDDQAGGQVHDQPGEAVRRTRAQAGAGRRPAGRGRGPGRGAREQDECQQRRPWRRRGARRAVPGVRLGAGRAAAVADRGHRARHRNGGHRPALARAHDGLVQLAALAADRAGRRRGLRPVHRHPLPAGTATRQVRSSRRSSTRSIPPGAR